MYLLWVLENIDFRMFDSFSGWDSNTAIYFAEAYMFGRGGRGPAAASATLIVPAALCGQLATFILRACPIWSLLAPHQLIILRQTKNLR